MGALVLLLAFVLVIGVVRGQSALIMLSSLLIVATLAFGFWSRRAAGGLTYRRYFDPPRIFPGEETEYVVELTNGKWLPLPWARIEEHMPSAVIPAGDATVRGEDGWQRRRTLSLGWHERVVLRQRFTCRQRGDYVVGPTDIETGDPLGLFPVHVRVPETRALVVYPRLASVPPIYLASRFPFGTSSARPPALEDPMRFAGLRDYRPGDPRRWVDWKASARRMSLQTRVFAPTTLNTVIVGLNVQTMAFAWQGYNQPRLEAAIGVAGALVRDAIAAAQPVGLAANSSGAGMEEFQVYLRPNRRPSQLEDALGLLARLSPLPTMAFGAFLRRIAATFPYGASLIAVTGFLDQLTADDLSALVRRGHAVILVFLGDVLEAEVDERIQAVLLPDVAVGGWGLGVGTGDPQPPIPNPQLPTRGVRRG